MKETIWSVEFEIDETGAVAFEQDDGCGNKHYVNLHPVHLRLLFERAGLLDPGAVDRQHARELNEREETIGKLVRRIHLLRRRIVHLDEYLHECSDTAHANMDYEQGFSQATSDIAEEFCLEYPEPDTDHETCTTGAPGVANAAPDVKQTNGNQVANATTGAPTKADLLAATRAAFVVKTPRAPAAPSQKPLDLAGGR